ncbi:hypothetical protein GGI04_000991 [Coemansia thaxteri]|nr:hypothetical protein GGI04_000991 [Coemansia thaxteri]KAJ2471940.1 hypothetical protein GGI02_001926 [Coemansia sp. RSA 2322]KAJ2487099.1 hypothetical protein EV174_000710 [Coemansia sp. RSA 2320]
MHQPSAERTPVYFVSHGGPTLLDDSAYPPDEPIARGLRRIGDEIRSLRPRGMVVISGHWESERPSSLQVNGKSSAMPLIYDFYNFPAWMYQESFEHHADPLLARKVADIVAAHNIQIDVVDRGLDHGVWVVSKKAGLAQADFPIIQLSLFANESMEDHIKLGQALQPLREQGIVVVGSGMAVHNLRDLFGSRSSPSDGIRSYVIPFDKEIELALDSTHSAEQRCEAVAALAYSANLRSAHPTLEHLLPLHVAVGAAGHVTTVEKLVEAYQASLSWSCYRFL